jgi:hypothetical protein
LIEINASLQRENDAADQDSQEGHRGNGHDVYPVVSRHEGQDVSGFDWGFDVDQEARH